MQASSFTRSFAEVDDRAQSPESFWASASCSLHPTSNTVALVFGQSLGIFPLHAGEEASKQGQEATLVEVCKFPEQMTALCWISYAGQSTQLQDTCLLLGTSLGYLQLHNEEGQLLHRQRIHTGRAQTIQARTAGRGVKPDDHSEDLSVTFTDAIVRLSSLSLRSVVRYQQHSQLWGQPGTAPPLSYNIWDLHKSGPRSSGVCAGLKPPSLYGTLTGRDTNHKLLLLTTGRDPALAAYEAEEVLQRGSLAFVSNLASSVASGVLGIARAAVVGRQSGFRAGLRNWVAAKASTDPPAQPGSSQNPKEDDLPKGEPVTLFRSLRDGPRAVDQLLLAPRGLLAVARDNFGRVLLIDIATLTVIRVWKSYRDAQAGWILGNVDADTLSRHQPRQDQEQTLLHAWSGRKRKADSSIKHEVATSSQQQPNLCLVLYAPRRRSLELWQMRHGHRIAIAQVPLACKLLQRVVPFGLQFELSDLSGHRLPNGQLSGFDQCLILDVQSGQSMDVLDALQRTRS